MMSFASAALVAIIFLVIFYFVDSIYRLWQTSKGIRRIPCDPTVPVIGNGLPLVKATTLSELRSILLSYQRDVPLSCAWIFNKLIIMVNEPKFIEALIAKSSNKPEEIYGIFSHMSNGIFIRNGEKWAKLRNPLNKLMHTKFINRWVDIFSNKANDFCQIIATHQDSFELEHLCFQCTLGIVSETHLGVENSNQIDGKDQFYGLMRKVLENGFMEFLPRKFNFLSSRRESLVRQGWEIVNSIINQRRKMLESKDSINVEPTCYTDVVLQVAEEEGANEEETCRLAIDLLVAGSDTTSTTISCAILFLAMHPEYREKVEDELFQIFNDSRRTPSVDDLNKMKYLEMVIYETLRHCGVPVVAKRLDRQVDLDDYQLPSNSILFFRFMNACRDPRWWERPCEFYPDHFLPEAVAARPKGSFTPFGAGARSCPGKLYAVISVKVILSVALREFKFTTDLKFKEVKYEYGLMQSPESMMVKAHPRVLKSTNEAGGDQQKFVNPNYHAKSGSNLWINEETTQVDAYLYSRTRTLNQELKRHPTSMEESYKARKEREERERRFQKKKRLENARRAYLEFINDPKPFNLGVKYNMIDQLAEELAQYLDMVDVRRVLTEMLEFVYDPSMRPEDPVDYFAKLTKDRKKDKRELNKARRHLYQLMWKEYDIKEEIAKLRTLLYLTNPREFKPDGTERTEEEKIEFDKASDHHLIEISDHVFKTESLRSLMEHKDQRIPQVFGNYSTPAPEPMAVSGKEIMAERAALIEKSKKAKAHEMDGKGSTSGKGKKGKKDSAKKKSKGKSPSKSRSKSRSKSAKRSRTRSANKRSRSGKPK